MMGMSRPAEVQHTADVWTPAAVEESESSEESEDSDDDQVCLRGRRECAEEVRLELLDKFLQWNSLNEHPKPVPKCLEDKERCLLRSRMPAWLPENDKRFHPNKKLRVFVCDTPRCEEIVKFSFAGKHTRYRRADCDFAGSFACQDWADLPPFLRKEAWEKRFINAVWHCTQFCDAEMTISEAQQTKRDERNHKWQQQQSEAGKAGASASSSASSSACPPSGKGAKGHQAGKAKRSREDMEGGKSKGSKKGGSKNERPGEMEAGQSKASKKRGSDDGMQPPWRRGW